MKHFIYFSFLAIIVAGCNDNSTKAGKASKTTVNEESQNDVASTNNEPGINDVDVDTLGMAEFLALKAAAARNRQSSSIQTDDISYANDIDVDTVGFAAYKRQKAEMARQSYEDSIQRAEIIAERKRYNASKSSATTRSGSKNSKSGEEITTANDTEVASAPVEEVKEKKGWSKRAKGAVIGAATGAAAGAVIHKRKRGVGGVVGGVVGAAAGYGIGRHKEKKEEKKDTTVIEQQ